MRSPTIARPISPFPDVDGMLPESASHPDVVVVGRPPVARFGAPHLDTPGGSPALRDALAAGPIGEVPRSRAHA